MKNFNLQYRKQSQALQFHIQKEMQINDIFAFYRISKKQRYQYYIQKCVRINGIVKTQNQTLYPQDVLEIAMIKEPSALFPWDQKLTICYEDDCILAVSKPVGMLVHSDGVNTTHTLHNCVQAYYHSQQINAPVRAIHRLDLETSGLVVYCKIPFFQAYLDALLQEKKIERIYLAWVKGIVSKEKIIIDQPIGKDRHNSQKMRISPTGAPACTILYPKRQISGATLVECHLQTGRTHQIRVHLSAIHHPILSDSLYGTKDARINRCALHAWKLHLYHPLLEKRLTILCPLNDDMKLD